MRAWLWNLPLLLVLLTQAVPGAEDEATPAEQAAQPLVVFLVRHAEKVDSSTDAALSPAGQQRAGQLAQLLRDASLDQVHSTDFARTRDTAAPTAAAPALAVEIYAYDKLPALAAHLRAAGGRHLVVGHSDTTPELVALLGGEPGGAIAEAWEYDRLYMVSITPGRAPETILLRYGDRSAPR